MDAAGETPRHGNRRQVAANSADRSAMSPASFPHAHFGGVTLTARQARASSLYRPSTARTLAGTSEPAACLMDPEFVSWAPWRSRFPAEWQGSAQGQALGPRWPAHARAQGAQDLGHGDHVEQVV